VSNVLSVVGNLNRDFDRELRCVVVGLLIRETATKAVGEALDALA
jgi:hypothetical protein